MGLARFAAGIASWKIKCLSLYFLQVSTSSLRKVAQTFLSVLFEEGPQTGMSVPHFKIKRQALYFSTMPWSRLFHRDRNRYRNRYRAFRVLIVIFDFDSDFDLDPNQKLQIPKTRYLSLYQQLSPTHYPHRKPG